MPLPSFLISVNAFLCERTLIEADGVFSAIRIVDVFLAPEQAANVPEEALPLVQAYGCVIIKAVPRHHEEHTIELKMIDTAGEIKELGEPTKARAAAKAGMEDIPAGITISVQLNIRVKRLGTCYLCLYIDGQEVARTPFTLLRKPTEKNG
jgi:hypothetical protein